MKQFLALAVALVLVVGAVGCHKDSSKGAEKEGDPAKDHEANMKAGIKAVMDIAQALERAKDKDSSKAAAAKIHEACDRLQDLRRKADKLPKLSNEEHRKLYDRIVSPELQKPAAKWLQDAERVSLDSGEPELMSAVLRYRKVGLAGEPD